MSQKPRSLVFRQNGLTHQFGEGLLQIAWTPSIGSVRVNGTLDFHITWILVAFSQVGPNGADFTLVSALVARIPGLFWMLKKKILAR
jgi:hypothetical protein